MTFQIIRNDITKVKADAIVNTANPEPIIGAGTDSAVYKAAGENKLLAERKKIGIIARGEVAVTPAFGLKAKYIIHTVGPIWENGNKGEFNILRSCYSKSLNKAAELGCESIAFPLIATGVYGFPKVEALQIAMNEISSFLMREDTDMTVKLVVFDDKAFRLSENLFFQVESFIDDEEVIKAHQKEYGLSNSQFSRERERFRREREALKELKNDYSVYGSVSLGEIINSCEAEDDYGASGGKVGSSKKKESIKPFAFSSGPFNEDTFDKSQYMNDGKEELSFRDHLIKLMNEKEADNIEAYKSSNITKGAFSKILCGDTKRPQKKTVLGFCIGLKLSMEEAEELLASADMAFNPYNKRDKLVIQCIERGQYDIDTVNMMLFLCDQPQLGN